MYKKTHLGSWKSKQDNYVKFHWLLAEELIFTAMPDILVELVQSYWGAGLVQSCRMFSYGPSGLGWTGLTTSSSSAHITSVPGQTGSIVHICPSTDSNNRQPMSKSALDIEMD